MMDLLQYLTDEQIDDLIRDSKTQTATRLETLAGVLTTIARLALTAELERRRATRAKKPAA